MMPIPFPRERVIPGPSNKVQCRIHICFPQIPIELPFRWLCTRTRVAER